MHFKNSGVTLFVFNANTQGMMVMEKHSIKFRFVVYVETRIKVYNNAISSDS